MILKRFSYLPQKSMYCMLREVNSMNYCINKKIGQNITLKIVTIQSLP